MKKFKAFTLSEVMVTLALMSVLASVMLPIVKDLNPDRNKAAFKKAYYVVERVVYDMVTDEDLYPSLGTYKGFDNTEEVTYHGVKYSGNTKFCKLFQVHVNKVSTFAPTSCSTQFFTSDGIGYTVPSSDFSNYKDNTESAAKALKITVDVNGTKEPNKDQQDRFSIYVKADGRIFVLGNKEKEYMASYSTQRGKK